MRNLKDYNIRQISLSILKEVVLNKNLLNTTFDLYFGRYILDERDKSFIEYECKGVIEKKNELDDIINKYSKVKTKKLDDNIYIMLLIGTFEIHYMDKVPNYATIYEIVNLTKVLTKGKLTSFVNGVLRNIERNKENCDLNESKIIKNKYCYFKICNDKEIQVLDEIKEKNKFCKKYDGALNFKYSNVYYAKSYKDILELENFKSGNILISDASSLFLTDKLTELVKNKISDKSQIVKIIDVCAAPGGKSLSLCGNLKDINIYIKACDISERKITKIIENVKRLNINCIDVIKRDATIFDNNDFEKFDVVICDVPCTGLGVIGKKPDIKEHYTKEKLDNLVKIQNTILDVSSKYLRKGGLLSYSTCTITQEENEDMIEKFIEAKGESFKKMFEKRINVLDENLADGFYMCIMEKEA